MVAILPLQLQSPNQGKERKLLTCVWTVSCPRRLPDPHRPLHWSMAVKRKTFLFCPATLLWPRAFWECTTKSCWRRRRIRMRKRALTSFLTSSRSLLRNVPSLQGPRSCLKKNPTSRLWIGTGLEPITSRGADSKICTSWITTRATRKRHEGSS